jgi:CxxC-x17-CxxC domain-containing protein
MSNSDITYFGVTTFRNQEKKFGIKRDDRRRHFYSIGKTGMGKSVMLENMAIQDIKNGEGVGFIDPHGEAAETLLKFVPQERVNDVIYFNPSDLERVIGFNVMEEVDKEHRHLVASGLMGVFKKIWPDVWSARMEYILNNTILALLDYPSSTLLGISRMMSDATFRDKVVEKIGDPVVKSFWTKEFSSWSQQYASEAVAAIQNKVGQFASSALIRNIVGQVTSSIDMEDVINNKKILIVDLSKGKLGEDNSMLLGALLITKLQIAAMARVKIPEKDRKDFFLYIDEFQNFATRSFINILSEARKYRLSLILSHQYIGQLDDQEKGTQMQDAILGNVGTIVTFRLGSKDAELLEKEFATEIKIEDIINLPKYNIYTKLMIDGISGAPFSARTLPPLQVEEDMADKAIRASRERYGRERAKVEEKLSRWLQDFEIKKEEQKPFQQDQNNQELYDAICSSCGKKTKVPFLPDESRPTYCKSCRKKGALDKKPKQEKEKEKEKKEEKKNSFRDAINQVKKQEEKKGSVNKLREAIKNAFQKNKQ